MRLKEWELGTTFHKLFVYNKSPMGRIKEQKNILEKELFGRKMTKITLAKAINVS